MNLTGRAILGLDEFMLRLGHLTLLCEIAATHGGASHRFEKSIVRRFTESVLIEGEQKKFVAPYLVKKRLCIEVPPGEEVGELSGKFRYSDIGCSLDSANNMFDVFSISEGQSDAEIWLQDFLLSEPGVPSRVGGVAVAGRSGSKTGVSHLIDWGGFLNLFSKSGKLTPSGQLVVGQRKPTGERVPFNNPYVMTAEKIILAYEYLRADFDVFSKLIISLVDQSEKVSKADATKIFVNVVQEIAKEASVDKRLASRERQNLFSLLKDLERATKRGRKEIFATSTAWHRASSRFETLVDMGLLSKDDQGEKGKYEYTYFVTERLRRTAGSLQSANTMDEWFDAYFLDVVWDCVSSSNPVSPQTVLENVGAVASALQRPTAPIPLNSLALGLQVELAVKNQPFRFDAIVDGVRAVIASMPEKMRISGGTRDPRTQFVSVNIKKLA